MSNCLTWIKENEYLVNLPVTDKDKVAFRDKLVKEIEPLGFIHDDVKGFVRGGFWCDLVTFTLRSRNQLNPTDYIICFLYDCRNTPYRAKHGKLEYCESFHVRYDEPIKTSEKARQVTQEMITKLLSNEDT